MTFGRRAFCAGALAGVAAAGIAPRSAAARISSTAPDPVMLLLDPDAPPAFIAAATGALAASRLSVIDRRGGEARVLVESVAWLAARPGRRMVGLLSDADAVLLDQFTRDGAIRCLSSAQHCGSAGASGQSRHRITALPSNAGLARLLADELAAAGTNFSVVTEPLTRPGIAGPVTKIPASAHRAGSGWEAVLGGTMAMIAAGNWPNQTPDRRAAFESHGAATETFALRSFVFAS
nr:hypothetical protein [uncultured Rhodopila sp.]